MARASSPSERSTKCSPTSARISLSWLLVSWPAAPSRVICACHKLLSCDRRPPAISPVILVFAATESIRSPAQGISPIFHEQQRRTRHFLNNTCVLVSRRPSTYTNADPATSPVHLRRIKEAFPMKFSSRSRLAKYFSKGKDPGC